MLEVRLLYNKLEDHNRLLEQTVLERTAELRESEARFRRLTNWPPTGTGSKTIAGNSRMSPARGRRTPGNRGRLLHGSGKRRRADGMESWPSAKHCMQRSLPASPSWTLRSAARIPTARSRQFRVSGEPMFNLSGRFIGYRGIGIEVAARA